MSRPFLVATPISVPLVAVALGKTLAPWGLAFIQSYAVDKRLTIEDLRYERVDVIVGAVLTGIIGLFIVVACAATLHADGVTIHDASDAAGALEPLAGHLAATLFGLGLLGAALLAACIVALSTAYSVAEAFRQPGDINDSYGDARLFYLAYGAVVALAVAIVLIPGAPLVSILFLSQALNAVLLLLILQRSALIADRSVRDRSAADATATAAAAAPRRRLAPRRRARRPSAR